MCKERLMKHAVKIKPNAKCKMHGVQNYLARALKTFIHFDSVNLLQRLHPEKVLSSKLFSSQIV